MWWVMSGPGWGRLAGLVVAVVLVGVATWVLPVPTPAGLRVAAEAAGPAFVVLFVAVHALLTMAPLPRAAFTVSAGLLFGPVLGVGVCVLASTLSAVLVVGLIRSWGRGARRRPSGPPHSGVLARIDDRLTRGGGLAVLALRLIPGVPFAALNYGCAVSSVGMAPFVTATAVGLIPGTVSTVLLGSALTGPLSPVALLISGGCAALGVLGLLAGPWLQGRIGRRR